MIKVLIILAVVFTILIPANAAFAQTPIIMEGHIRTVDAYAPIPGGHFVSHFFFPEDSETAFLLNFENTNIDWSDIKGKQVKIMGFQPNVAGSGSGSADLPFHVTEISPVDSPDGVAAFHTQQSIPSSVKSVTLLSKYADVSAEPHDVQYFQNIFYDNPDSLSQFFLTSSYDQFSWTGIVSDWKPLPKNAAAYNAGYSNAAFDLMITDSIAVHDSTVDFTGVTSLILVFNDFVDPSGSAFGSIGNWGTFQTNEGPITVRVTWEYDSGTWFPVGEDFDGGIGVTGHELGHNLQFDHTPAPPGSWLGGFITDPYHDPWSIMSTNTDHTGPSGLIMGQRDQVGWVASNDKVTIPRGTSSTVTLDYINQPASGPNPHMAIVPLPSGNSYIIEAHTNEIFNDTPNNNEGIMMYNFFPNGNQYPYLTFGGGYDKPAKYGLVATSGSDFEFDFQTANLDVGETYTDSNNVTVTTISKTATSVTVAISNNGTTDSDGDGFTDDVDSCPTVAGVAPDGCPLAPVDTDGDGFTDDVDSCPTVAGVAPDGCPLPLIDSAGTADFAVIRNGFWFIDTNLDGEADIEVNFGLPTDELFVGDFDGDGVDDLVVNRNGFWFIDTNRDGDSQDAGDIEVSFGLPTDELFVGDFDGDGADDIVVNRNGFWFIDTNRDGDSQDPGDIEVGFGLPTDTLFRGDFNGDGADDLVVNRNGFWFIDVNRDGDSQDAGDIEVNFGLPTDTLFVGDFDGDGSDDITVNRNGFWFIDTNRDGDSLDAGDIQVSFGLPTDELFVGDFDGDGADDIALYRDGFWSVDTNLDGTPDITTFFGTTGDIPLVGNFNTLSSNVPSDSGTAFSFGGTLESATKFNIMNSDGTTSTYGKQGYSYGFKAIGTGISQINSDQICGLSLCWEKMSTAEKIQQYLDQLFSEKSATTQRGFGGVIDFDSSASVIPSSDTTITTDTEPPQIFEEVHWDSCQRQITIVFEPNHGIDPNGNHDLSLVEVRDSNSNRHFSLERSNILEISSDHITLELKKKHSNQLENRMTSPTLTAFDGAFVDESGNRSNLTTDVPIFDVCF